MKRFKYIGSIGVALILSGMFLFSSFNSSKTEEISTRSNIKYSLKSDYIVYKVYWTGMGYCPSASRNDGTTSSVLWGFPTCD